MEGVEGVEGEELQLDPSELDTSRYCPIFGPRMMNLDEPSFSVGLPLCYTTMRRTFVSPMAGLADDLRLTVGL